MLSVLAAKIGGATAAANDLVEEGENPVATEASRRKKKIQEQQRGEYRRLDAAKEKLVVCFSCILVLLLAYRDNGVKRLSPHPTKEGQIWKKQFPLSTNYRTFVIRYR